METGDRNMKMKKHLYFHSSNLEQIREIKKDANFEPYYEYGPMPDKMNQHQYEYGRIKTDTNYYHFIMGNPRQEGCPWCGGTAEIIEGITSSISPRKYCIQCMRCGARGPTLNVNTDQAENPEVVALLWQRFETRRTWDDSFINPYGERK